MTARATVRPAWVEELVARHGEPTVDVSDAIPFGGRQRRSWHWNAGGWLRIVVVDETGMESRPYVARACGIPGRQADLVCTTEPTDDEMRALVTLAWGGAA